jgi:hypothetical protein
MLARLKALDALDDAMDFTRDAWRDAFLAMAVVAVGWTLLVAAGHGRMSPSVAAGLRVVGLLLLLFHLPLWGGLYRQALGEPTAKGLGGLGRGGLQLGLVEARILGLNAAFAAGLGVTCAPTILVAAVVFLLLHGLGGVTLGPLGHWAWWFVVVAVMVCALAAGLAYLCGRLSLSTPLSLKTRRVTPWAGWDLTDRQAWPIAAAFIAAHAPTALVLLGLMSLSWIEPTAAPPGLHGAWPVLDAVAAGLVVGTVLAAVQAPLSIGVIGFAYDMLTPMETRPALHPELAPVADPSESVEPAAEPVASALPETAPEPQQTEPALEEPAQNQETGGPVAAPDAAPATINAPPSAVPPLDGADEAEHATA